MHRWIKRLVTTIAMMLVLGGGVAWWLVQQTRHVPEFYARATQRLPKPSGELSRRMHADVKKLQRDVATVGYWRAELSDDEINAWLVEELPRKFPRLLARGASDPRVVIEDDRILVAVRYKNRRIDTVISCEVQVALTEQPNMLALKLRQLKAGSLPLPLSKFRKGISKEAARGDVDVRWDTNESGPIALVTVPSEDPRYVINPVTVESVELSDGRLMLAGHTGSLAHALYSPQGPVYRFVSYQHGASINRHGRGPSPPGKPVVKLR